MPHTRRQTLLGGAIRRRAERERPRQTAIPRPRARSLRGATSVADRLRTRATQAPRSGGATSARDRLVKSLRGAISSGDTMRRRTAPSRARRTSTLKRETARPRATRLRATTPKRARPLGRSLLLGALRQARKRSRAAMSPTGRVLRSSGIFNRRR